ncbi:DUF3987 domain-containing protein [Jiulongibacter sediminis]|uniref:DUF3987 domain-containing protein n=1 Tax=Jiulongibacter sediminis TaxID=1605367 RepID=UPI0009E9A7CD|nr:DUF3987 domain-containing protein [Jiulongibacter sediminis]
MASSTIFKGFSTPIENKSLLLLSKRVGTDEFKETVEEVRRLKELGQIEEAQKLKQSLLAFTPSATFKGRRLMAEIDHYSGFVHLDFDKIPENQLTIAIDKITQDLHTFWCFRSPGGDGLKVFVQVDSGQEHHDIAYLQVQEYYEKLTGLPADEKCKDITRLCFFSYDPDMYRNISNQKFEVKRPLQIIETVEKSTPPPVTTTEKPSHILEELFRSQVNFTNQKSSYTHGSRNNFIYLLASNCNRVGIPLEVCLDLSKNQFDLPHKEMETSVRSAYNHHSAEFGNFAKLANKQIDNSSPLPDEQEDYLKSTPTLPDDIFDKLPDILRVGSEVFQDKRQRDVFLTSALSILSGCLPGIYGYYSGEKVFPHLYTFVIAPAASGKGVLKNAKRLGDKYHERVLSESTKAQTLFEDELTMYKEALRNRKKGEAPPTKPNEPKFRLVFIPADSSSSRMIDHLQKNGGEGIICETEADTMSGTKKQDWGDYSPVIRAGFHHEKITLSRKTNNEYIEIKEPRLAICLSGTPAQVPRLISSAEDGLFSRFLFYAFKNDLHWLDPSPFSRKFILTDHFEGLSEKVLQMVDFLSVQDTEIEMSQDQWQALNSSFAKHLYQVGLYTGEEAASIVFRLGLIAFRIVMIFTALRKFENGEFSKNLVCTDEDVQIALDICQVYLQHSLLMFSNLPGSNQETSFKPGDSKRKFFEALPQNFTRQEAQTLGKTFSLGVRTIDQILRNALGKDLRKVKSGVYERITSNNSYS